MKKLFVFFVIMFCFLSFTNISFANRENESRQSKNYFIAFYSASEVEEELIESLNGKIHKKFKHIPVITATLSEEAVMVLKGNPNIEYIEEVGMVKAHSTNTLPGEQEIPWGISHINADIVHSQGITGKGINIGILDSGIDYTHPDLRVIDGVNFVSEGQDFMDNNGHGTRVAGIISSLNNTIGILGIAPDANLYAIKVLDKYGSGDYSNIIQGI